MDYPQAAALNEVLRTIGMRHRALAGALLAPLGLHPGQEVLLTVAGLTATPVDQLGDTLTDLARSLTATSAVAVKDR